MDQWCRWLGHDVREFRSFVWRVKCSRCGKPPSELAPVNFFGRYAWPLAGPVIIGSAFLYFTIKVIFQTR